MPTISTGYATIGTLAKQLRAQGKPRYARCLETLIRAGDVLDMFPIMKANQGTVHKFPRRKSLGSGGVWRALNQGVPASNPEVEEATEVTGKLEDRCDIDEDALSINDNSSAFIENQNEGVRIALRNTLNDTIIYGNRAAPGNAAGLDGLATRYNAFGKVVNENTGYDHVQDFGGSGNDLTSVYLLAPGVQSLYLINADNGCPAGLSIKEYDSNNGVFLNDRDGNPFRGHRTWYKWPLGLAVENVHSVMRLANIPSADVGNLIANGISTPSDSALLRKMIQMKNMVSADVDKSKLLFLVSRDVFTTMDILMFEKANAYWTPSNLERDLPPRSVGMFAGLPVFMSDTLIGTESQVQ